MTKVIDERIDEGVLRWFDYEERMQKNRIAKRVCVGECAGIRSLGRSRKRWMDTVKDCLIKRGLDIWQARRMAEVFEGKCMGLSPGDEPQTLTRCRSCGLSTI